MQAAASGFPLRDYSWRNPIYGSRCSKAARFSSSGDTSTQSPKRDGACCWCVTRRFAFTAEEVINQPDLRGGILISDDGIRYYLSLNVNELSRLNVTGYLYR